VATAADLLWDCWQNGRRLQSIPEEVRPQTRDEGYAVQATLERRSAAPLFGWKIAATSIAGQKHINVTGPLAGRLLHERVTDLSRRLVRRSPGGGGCLGVSVCRDRQLGADDRAEAGLLRGLVEPGRAIDAVGVEQRQRRIVECGSALDERFGKRCTLQKAEGRRGVEFDVHGRQ
jgi:hypothetical protein